MTLRIGKGARVWIFAAAFLLLESLLPPPLQPTARVCCGLIDAYRAVVSGTLRRNGIFICKFTPTCSEYTREAIVRYGTLRGGFMGLCRIMRCNKWSEGGFDPVP